MTDVVVLLVRLTGVVAMGLVVTALTQRQSAAVRHAVLLATVCGAASMPLTNLIVPAWWPNSASTTRLEAGVVARVAPATSRIEAPDSIALAAAPAAHGTAMISGALAAWGAISLLGLARLARDIQRLRSERQAWPEWTDQRVVEALRRAAAALGVRRRVRLLQGDASSPVITWGLRTPHLRLPRAAETWPREQLDVVMTHELAHVVRYDWVSFIALELALSLYWWHPLLRRAVSEARRLAEHACDDIVLEQGGLPSAYADVLLDVARSTRPPHSSVVTAITHTSLLERRIAAMLDTTIDHTTPRGRTLAFAAAPLVLLALAVSGAGAQPRTGNGGAVTGHVRPNGGRPLPGIEVVFAGENGDRSVRTDASGAFSLAMPGGTYRASVRVPGFRRFETVVQVEAGSTVPRDFALVLSSLTESIHVAGATDPTETPVDLRPGVPVTRTLGVITTPHRITLAPPPYPSALRTAGIEGIVKVSARVGADGYVSDVAVVESAHPQLAAIVTEHVARWRYEPTRVQDIPMATDVTVTFTFSATQ